MVAQSFGEYCISARRAFDATARTAEGYGADMSLEGEYEASPWDAVADQVALYESTQGREGAVLEGLACIVLTTRGRKSGKLRKTPLMRVNNGDCYAVVGSMGGAPDDPAWVGNVVAEPHVMLQDGPVCKDYTARQAEGDEKAKWWAIATQAYPPYDDYQASTTRVIPLFVLEPRV